MSGRSSFLRLSKILAHFHSTSIPAMSRHSQLRESITKSLADFAASDDAFKVINTVPQASPRLPLSEPHTIYVVDSSFNPPHHAHSTLARKGVAAHRGSGPQRICLLLATQNADKKPKPAAFEDRLVMMSLMGESLAADTNLTVDVAVTKKPFFMDKAASMDESGVYGSSQQVHCTGYDTIIRIFDKKYYGEEGFSVLEPFLTRHKLRVSYRVGEGVEGGGDRDEQDHYVASIGDGSRAGEGIKQEWASAIELVDDADSVKGVSSTKAREAAMTNEQQLLIDLVGNGVADYVKQMKLYKDIK